MRSTDAAGGHWHILTGCRKGHVRSALATGGPDAAAAALADLVDRFGADRVSVELTQHGHPLDDEINAELAELATRFGLRSVATTGAHFAAPSRRRLAMAMGAIRARQSLDEAAGWLAPLGGSHLRSGEEMARLFAQRPDAVTAAAELGEQCAFGLALIAPQLPPFDVPPGHTEDSWLRELAMAGAERRYGPRAQARQAYAQIEHELEIIAQLTFPGYFLVVYDITRFCRENNILCQGRGSAANSAVCYALGVTAVDPVANELLFERFLSPVRDGPPDIDIDIESDQREKVIQYVYDKYGRDYAAQVANVITYRARIAVRDMARALGFSQGQQDAWSKQISHWGATAVGCRGRPRAGDRPGHPDPESAAAHGHPLRRHGDLRPADRRCLPGGMGAHGEPQRIAVGQRRLRGNRFGEIRPARAGHALGVALRHRPGGRAQRHRGRPGQVGPVRIGGVRNAGPRRFRRGVPGGVPRADGHPAAAAAEDVLRPGGRGRVDPPRAHPGWLGAPVHPAAQRRRPGRLRPSVDGVGVAENVGSAVVSGAADAARGGLRRLFRRRGRSAAARHGIQAVDRTHATVARPVLRRHARECTAPPTR